MTALFLAPHNDDETLFGSYSICFHAPDVDVVTVLRSDVQERRGTGIRAGVREQETANALMELVGLVYHWEQWEFSDADPDWPAIRARFTELSEREMCGVPEYTRVYAPVSYGKDGGGHPHHDLIGELAVEVFGERVMGYHTYVNGRGRVQGTLINPDPEWVIRKLRALACYGSQIREKSTGHHFQQALYEWHA